MTPRLLFCLAALALSSACKSPDAPAQPSTEDSAVPSSPAPAVPAPPNPVVASAREDIDVDTLATRLATPGTILIDVRTPSEYRSSHVPGAKNIPIDELEGRIGEVPRDLGTVHVICASGGRSSTGTDLLVAQGFAKVANVEGGTKAWIASMKPVDGGSPDDKPPEAAPSSAGP